MVRTKVFVGNLSFQTKEAELATEFAVAGKVISANIITRGPRSLGYGFVEFDSEEDAQNAVNLLSKKEINGRAVNVEIAKPQDETKRQPRPPRPEGENGGPRRRPRKSFRKKEGEEGEKKPQESKKEEVEEEKPRRRSRPRRPRPVSGGSPGERRVPTEDREESKTTLFVANLPFNLDDAAFAKIVTDLNLKLKSAHVVKKRNGRSKGYGFIEFDSQDDQQKALAALNKKVVDSRELSVKVALTEIKHEGAEQPQQQPPAKEAKPVVENKVASPEKKTAPVEKKSVPVAEKKSSPAPVAEKKSSPAPVAEKKVSPAPEKKASPAPEKKASPAPQEKKTPSTEKKQEAKSPEKDEKKK